LKQISVEKVRVKAKINKKGKHTQRPLNFVIVFFEACSGETPDTPKIKSIKRQKRDERDYQGRTKN
jgi:hypothetical protein